MKQLRKVRVNEISLVGRPAVQAAERMIAKGDTTVLDALRDALADSESADLRRKASGLGRLPAAIEGAAEFVAHTEAMASKAGAMALVVKARAVLLDAEKAKLDPPTPEQVATLRADMAKTAALLGEVAGRGAEHPLVKAAKALAEQAGGRR